MGFNKLHYLILFINLIILSAFYIKTLLKLIYAIYDLEVNINGKKRMLVKGRVQGVGLRFFCRYTANSIANLTGYVKNLDNGDVLIQIQGNIDSIKKFKQKIYTSNGFFKITDIIEKNIKIVTNEKNFSILY